MVFPLNKSIELGIEVLMNPLANQILTNPKIRIKNMITHFNFLFLILDKPREIMIMYNGKIIDRYFPLNVTIFASANNIFKKIKPKNENNKIKSLLLWFFRSIKNCVGFILLLYFLNPDRNLISNPV